MRCQCRYSFTGFMFQKDGVRDRRDFDWRETLFVRPHPLPHTDDTPRSPLRHSANTKLEGVEEV